MTQFNDRRNQQLVLPGMEHLQPAARAPEVDSALERRLALREANRWSQRGRQNFLTPTARGHHDVLTPDYGLPIVDQGGMGRNFKMTYQEFGPFAERKYAAKGTTKLVPRNELSTLQHAVSGARTEQIRRDPKAGEGRRTPGFIQGIDHGRGVTITNGNHRATADLANGALFVPVRTVPAAEGVKLSDEYLTTKRSRQKKLAQKKARG